MSESTTENTESTSSKVTELNDSDFKKTIVATPVAVVDIYASWCGTCRIFAPTFEKLAQKHDSARFYKIDGDANPEFRSDLEIDGLPYFAVYKHGLFEGGLSTTNEESLENFLRKTGAIR